MEIYVNGVLRSDILLKTDSSMEMESSHTATSSVKVVVPSSSTPLSECDFIQFKEQNGVIYSGTIMQIKQDTFAISDLSFKGYELTISDNSELLSVIFADLTFQQNVNIMQILFGNLPSHEWYDNSIPDFSGLDVKMEAEGITIGIVDDFSQFVLSEPANLWGMYIRDVLNSLSEIAGAWWEITPDKVFNMRYPVTAAPAPVNITSDSEIFNVSISRDAFSLYSAVRVVGGKGAGEVLDVKLTPHNNISNHKNATVISSKIIQTKFPINSIPGYISIVNEGAAYEGKVGVKGIDDNKGYDAYYSYGSDIIEISSSSTWSFPTLDGSFPNDTVSFSYVPLIQIYFRMVDDDLTSEIKAQRGGTGIIEQVISDSSVVSMDDAISVAKSFLSENKKRAFTVNFSSFIPGWSVGQSLTIDLPYYNVNGSFNVVSLKKIPVLQKDNSTILQYEVSASTVALREKYSKLFYTPKTIGFTIGTDFPNIQSFAFDNNIELKSSVSIIKVKYPIWSSLDDRGWNNLKAQYQSWEDFSSIFDSESKELHGLTEAGRNRFAYASGGNLQNEDQMPETAPDLCHVLMAIDSEGQYPLTAESVSKNAEQSVTSVYHIGVDELQKNIIRMAYFDGNEEIQVFPISFDKSASNPDGKFEVFFTITQTFAGKWLTADGKNTLINAIINADNVFSMNKLFISYINRFGDSVINTDPLIPSEIGDTYDGLYTVSYYIAADEFVGTFEALENLIQLTDVGWGAAIKIPTNIDHGENNPSGQYDLILVISNSFI